MKKFVMLTVVALLVRPAYCAVTAHLSLDCREGAKIADTTYPLIYDASWYAGGVTSKITANGQEIVSGAAGACAWAPSSDGVCLLTLSVYNDSDEVVGTEQVFCLSREDLTELVIPEGTMEISDYAFAGGLFTSVTIPSSVTSIGAGAFFDCSGLMSIAVDEENASYCSVDGVLYDKAKTELLCHPAGKIGCMAIPEGVSSIGVDAFSGCSGLTSVVIPEGVMSIGFMAFFGCDGLEKVYVSVGDLKRVKEMLVASCSGIDVDSLTFVEMLADGGPYKETVKGIEWTYTIVDGEAMIGPGGWNGAAISRETVGEIEIPSVLGGRPVTSIGQEAFDNCKEMTSVTIPRGVKSIGSDAFQGCSSLASVMIPKSVTNIGNYAFLSCPKLSAINVHGENTMYASFDGILYDKAKTKLMCCPGGKVGVVVVPEGVTSIGVDAFCNCDWLTSVTIPEGVTSIGDCAFDGCSGLTSVTIPNSVTSIGLWAFNGCGALTGVAIPVGMTHIARGAFNFCHSLTDVVLPSSVVSIGVGELPGFGLIGSVSAFYGCNGLSRVWCSKNDTERIRALLSSVGFNVNQVTFDEIGADDGVYTETIGGINWSVKISEGIAMVGTGSPDTPAVPRETVGSIEVPSSVTGVWSGELHGCSGLGSISLPVAVMGIDGFAFSGCDALTEVFVPSNITSIDDNAFRDCSGLAEIVVDDANPMYASVDGILYNKAKTKLLCCPEGRLDSLEIPSSVTSIREGAFHGCNKLKLIRVTMDSMEDVRVLL